MIDVATFGLVAVALVLLFAGATLSIYGIATLGMLIGGGGGYLVAPTVGAAVGLEGTLATAAGVTAGVLAGVLAAYLLFSVAVAAVSVLFGAYLGMFELAPHVMDGVWYVEWAAALALGLVAGFLGLVMTRSAMIFVTSFAGAALASRAVTLAELEAARTAAAVDPLQFELADPAFLALFVLGVLTQFGLFRFGYVTGVVAFLPGARMLRDGGRKGAGG